MPGEFGPFQGRWYCRREAANEDVEQYIDVHDELFFLAVNFRRGGDKYKTRQAVLALEAYQEEGELDFSVVRLIQDGADRGSEFEGRPVRARCRLDKDSLLLALPEPGEARPADLSGADLFRRR